MAHSNGEEVEDSLSRRHLVNGGTEMAAEDGGRSLGGVGGGGEDMSEESILKLQKEVVQLAEKVAEYREKGPVAFTDLLEKSLSQMRFSLPMMDSQVNKQLDNAAEIDDEVASSRKEFLEQREKLLERLASAKESLPTILRKIKSCKQRLDKVIIVHKESPAKHLPSHLVPLI